MKLIGRNKIVVYLIILMGIVALLVAKKPEELVTADIVAAFYDENYVGSTGSIEVVCEYDQVYLTLDEKKAIITEILELLGIKSLPSIDTTVEVLLQKTASDDELTAGKDRKITVKGFKETTKSSVEISFVTYENDKGLTVAVSNYIVIRVKIKDCPSLVTFDSTVYYKEKIEDFCKERDIDSRTTLGFVGELAGDKGILEKGKIAQRILSDLTAQVVSEYYEENIYYVYGYSKHFDEYVIDAGNKVNINIMIDYNEINGTTRINMVTPVIR